MKRLAKRVTLPGGARKRRARPEDAIQKAMVQWLRSSVPAPPKGPWWTAINPDPAKTNIIKGARLKALGLTAGAPDLVFVWKSRFIGVEVKPPKKYPSKEQKAVHQSITLCGGLVHVVRSSEELETFLRQLDVPVHGRIAA